MPNSWDTTISNSFGLRNLMFDDVQHLVMSEDICWRESGEFVHAVLVGEVDDKLVTMLVGILRT